MNKSTAYAIATQQAHKVGKTPKRGAGPRGMYGTRAGKREALQKMDKPRSEYTKTPAPKSKTAGLIAGLPLYRALVKYAEEQDPNTGLVVKAPSATISTSGQQKYTKVNVVSPPTPRNLDFAAKSVAPPPVRT